LTPTGINPTNMSQELLPVEVPESLSYVYPGKTMMPLGMKGPEVRNSLKKFV